MVALGGHALLEPNENFSVEREFENAREALRSLLPLIRQGAAVCLTHGNGPQVGSILLRSDQSNDKTYRIPLEVAVGQSEGEIGYLVQQTMVNLLTDERISRDVVGLLTQVEVDPNDPDFKSPSKPIGPYIFSKDAALMRWKGLPLTEVKGKGWRRLVPSPKPLRIIEASVVADLVSRGVIVIAAGGGGIPVARVNGRLEGVEAVIEKDRAAGALARALRADTLILLTDVDSAYLDYGKPSQKPIRETTLAECATWLDAGHFSPQNMGPKFEAAAEFLSNGGQEVIITTPEKLQLALDGKEGTRIVP